MAFDREDTMFLVVMNHEQQYSIWPDFKAVPAGWSTVRDAASKAECLAWIEANWTDMRPASLREAMGA